MMPSMRWIARLAACLLAAALCGPTLAQDRAAPEPTVAELRTRLDAVPARIDSSEEVRALVAQLGAIGAQANAFITSRTTQLSDLNARLGELGNAPADGAAAEDPDVTRQRTVLLKERNALDADIRLARLVMVDAQQRSSELLAQRRALFEAELTARAPSPLGRTFWNDIRDAWPADVARLEALGDELRDGLEAARDPEHAPAVLAGVVGALLLIVLGNWAAERALARLAARFLPTGRLRRSLLVVATVAVNVVLVALAAHGLHATLDAHDVWEPRTRELSQEMVQSIVFFAFLVGLGRALLSNGRPSWRLPPMPDAVARRLAPFPWLTALIAGVVWAPAQVNSAVDASFAAIVATHVVTALALTALIGAMLLRLRAPRQAAAAAPAPPDAEPAAGTAEAAPPLPERPHWVGLLQGAVLLMLVAIWVLVAIGYVALGSFLARQLAWTGIVAVAFYLLFKFADDLFTALLSARSSLGQRLQKSFGLAPQTLDQAAVLLTGLSRVALFVYMLLALAAPLGTGPDELFQRSGKLGTGVKIGEFALVPGAILGALAVLGVGFVALHVFKKWLATRYLPQTTLEPGMQSSMATLLGYVGGVFVIALALSALGIGIERIAWVASALSVGIGFGLQAIVQNFISGLILLAERPVKVGDWVVLGNVEGDVRRINVRATEIQLGDRSTLIVPNSEFITKTVRNMTLFNAEGRVLIRLPMPLSTDAGRAREVMLAACGEHAGVLAAPAPSVTLEGIENGMLVFQLIAYVSSPRLAGGVRSDLLFAILERMKEAGLPLAVPGLVLMPPTPPAAAHPP